MNGRSLFAIWETKVIGAVRRFLHFTAQSGCPAKDVDVTV
jgi:hypothetical protein